MATTLGGVTLTLSEAPRTDGTSAGQKRVHGTLQTNAATIKQSWSLTWPVMVSATFTPQYAALIILDSQSFSPPETDDTYTVFTSALTIKKEKLAGGAIGYSMTAQLVEA